MRQVLIRLAGIALIIAGIAGLIFSTVGLVVLVRVEKSVETALMQQIELVDRALVTTADGLAVAEVTLVEASKTAESVEATIASVGQGINGTVPTVNAMATLLGEQLPTTIETTQETLLSVATTARGVDDLLTLVTSMPFLGADRYNPDLPLYKGIEDVSASLDGVGRWVGEAQEGLTAAGSSLEALQKEVGGMEQGFGRMTTSLANAQGIVAEYQAIVADVQVLVATVREGLPQGLRFLHLGLSLVLIWLGIAQIGLITQGWELVGRSRATPPRSQDGD